MSAFRVSVQAPSNIALIKYMGKRDSSSNLPANPSISMTLNSLRTVAEVTVSNGQGIEWIPEPPQSGVGSNLIVPRLKDQDIARLVRHVERVQKAVHEVFQRCGLDVKTPGAQSDVSRVDSLNSVLTSSLKWTLRTANTFPASSGIASSASSFAAVTLASAAVCAKDPVAFEKAWKQDLGMRRALAQISRQGSGSSCRSFEGPWVQWVDEEAFLLDSSPTPRMAHFVVLIKTEPKKVSSSEAHARIQTSPLWQGRVLRVQERAQRVSTALRSGDLVTLARLAWTEAWEMHSLFHTCSEPFSYWEPGTIDGLHWFAGFLRQSAPELDCPPIVTLDAGPNIHVIVDQKHRDLWRTRLKEKFSNSVILEDEQGEGASILGLEAGAGVPVK